MKRAIYLVVLFSFACERATIGIQKRELLQEKSLSQGEPTEFSSSQTIQPEEAVLDESGTAPSNSGTPPSENQSSIDCVSSEWFKDSDADGYGLSTEKVMACLQPSGYVANSTDCDDSNASTYRLATYSFRDADGDALFTAVDGSICTGAQLPLGYEVGYASTLDCNDSNANVTASTPVSRYIDSDNDGFGVGSLTSVCPGSSGTYADNNYDADDQDAADTFNAISRTVQEVSSVQSHTATHYYHVGDFNLDGDVTDSFANVYLIGNPRQWLHFAKSCTSTDTSGCASRLLLVNDIVFSGGSLDFDIDLDLNTAGFQTDQINLMPAAGDPAVSFTGIIHGNGKVISGLHYSLSNYMRLGGIVGKANNSAIIRNIGFVNGSVTGKDLVGGIVGEIGISSASNSVRIYQTHNSSLVRIPSASSSAAFDIDRACWHGSYGNGSSGAQSFCVGGIVAQAWHGGIIERSYNTGILSITASSGYPVLGGIAGRLDGALARTSFNTGSLTASATAQAGDQGGIVGQMVGQASIENTYNTGTIQGAAPGGLVGWIKEHTSNPAVITSYNAGTVTLVGGGTDYASSLVVWIDQTCAQTFPTGPSYYLQTASINSSLPALHNTSCTSGSQVQSISSLANMRNASSFSSFNFWNGTTGAWTILPSSGSFPFLYGVTPSGSEPGKP